MTDKKMLDRRKHQRFRVREGVFAVLGPHSNKIGTIIDISMTGLAFNYMEDTVDQQDKSFELNIFLAEDSFHLNKIRFHDVTDVRAKEVPFSSINLRRRGVRFDTLTPAQTSQLEHFIRNHTMGEA